MTRAQNGNTVKVHYTGKLEDGTVFDNSRQREPLEFTVGQQQVIPGFEQAVSGMEEGETKTAKVSADQAYGRYREDAVVEVGRENLPDDLQPEVGQRLRVHQEGRDSAIVRVTDVSQDSVTLDANHPLAGKDLLFDIELLEVR